MSNHDLGGIKDLKHSSRGRRGLAAVNIGFDFTLSKPTQTFFVPFPETDMVNDMLKRINNLLEGNTGLPNVRGQMVSLVSVAISTDNTVIWYDHWEDSYETDITVGITSNFTQVWGDGKASNGCRPGIAVCSDANDYLNAGQSFVLENMMAVPRTSTNWFETGMKIDGGDKIISSFPISITRGTYSEYPGSLLAGAVEVYDTDSWGTTFEAPLGYDVVTATESFQHSRLFMMSGSDGNAVTLPGGVATVLNQGQSISVDIKQAQTIVSSKPMQVYLCAGDVGSNYEMRFFSVRPVSEWSDSYLSPVGDGYGRSKVILYNPNSASINIQFNYLNTNGQSVSTTLSVPSKKHIFSPIVPTNSGALVKAVTAGTKFAAMSMTDTETTVGDGTNAYTLNGQAFEWGATLPAVNKLTSQVLVGWGYGCTKNDCQGQTERSVVWIAPISDADIYIDYKNSGGNYTKLPMKKWQSARLRDTSDTDMSGAIIFATQPNTGPNGIPVDIATAWGQDASVSINTQSISLDLGTTIVPFTTIRVKKIVDKATASPGDILTYTITIQNVGQTDLKTGTFKIVDPAAFQGKYIADTTQYSTDGGATTFQISDDIVAGSTPFPLDGAGLSNPRDIVRRGGTHIVTFKFLVAPEILSTDVLTNTGYVQVPNSPTLPFTATTKLLFKPAIKVDNIVYEGNNGAIDCSKAVESLTTVGGANGTYCFTITNTGSTYLDAIKLTNADLSIPSTKYTIGKLAPGETKLVTHVGVISGNLKNAVVVTGTATYHGGATIPGVPEVAATDPSEVKIVAYAPNITISNTVYEGNNGPRECEGAGVEKVRGLDKTPVTYCFKITNNGNTYLSSVKLTDPLISFTKTDFLKLAPGESIWVSTPSTITANLINVATVTGTPSTPTGTAIAGLTTVSASDPSEVGKTIAGDVKNGDLPTPESCMQTNWEDAGNSQNLVCRAKEVFLNSLTTVRTSCTTGSYITLNVNASIHFNTERYDPAWYVALDGGDALTGTCAINGLVQGNTYKVTDGINGPIAGSVVWNNDFKGGNDKCGDVMINGGGGGDIEVPFLTNAKVKCVDDNKDSNLDISVCFSWRVPGSDGFCTLKRTEIGTLGKEADAYPGTPSKCFCTRVDIPTVTVETTADPVTPC